MHLKVSTRVMLAFSQPFYENQQNVGWAPKRWHGYILPDTSQTPTIARPQTVTTLPIYVLHALVNAGERGDAWITPALW